MNKEEKIPFGKEWIEGMAKHPKELLVDLLKNAYKELIELKQLEIKNNGWTKIEDESDLPEQGGDYHIIINDKLRKGTYVKNNRWFVVGNDFPKTTEIHGITHYQKITIPNLPLT